MFYQNGCEGVAKHETGAEDKREERLIVYKENTSENQKV